MEQKMPAWSKELSRVRRRPRPLKQLDQRARIARLRDAHFLLGLQKAGVEFIAVDIDRELSRMQREAAAKIFPGRTTTERITPLTAQ
jgi:hypothetical protein